jgi:CDP-glycerol glycerophosphotransferase (TagB/SpsB family)
MHTVARVLSHIGALLARPPLFLLYFASGLVPRRPDLWVFGSWGGHRFADNAASFFLYCQRHLEPSIRLVWISRDREIVRKLRADGWEAHSVWSLSGVVASLRAGVYLFDNFVKDINFWTSRSARKVNLWSGIPLKAVERDIDNPRSRYYRLFHGTLPERVFLSMMMPWHVDRPDLILATSERMREITCRAFDIREDTVAITGYPRNDVLFHIPSAGKPREEDWPAAFRKAYANGRFIFFYLPTYRDSGKPFVDVDWRELDEVMERVNASFFLKLHPDDRGSLDGSGDHIHRLPQKIDIYELLAFADALVSDYSSIIFDFMMLERPIIHYLPDLEEYRASSRSLIFDPVEIAVGPVCRTGSELATAFQVVASRADSAPEDRARWQATRRMVNRYADGDSNRRVLDAVRDRFPELPVPSVRERGAPVG